jgi:hypothetical protein
MGIDEHNDETRRIKYTYTQAVARALRVINVRGMTTPDIWDVIRDQ